MAKRFTPGTAIDVWRLPDMDYIAFIRGQAVQATSPRQLHQNFVIGVLEKGAHHIHFRGSRFTGANGHLLLAQPGDVLSCAPADEQGYSFRALHGAPEQLMALVQELTDTTSAHLSFPQAVVAQPRLSRTFLAVHKKLQGPASSLERVSLIQELFAQILQCCAGSRRIMDTGGKERAAVKKVREYLEENYAENVTLADLSKVAHLSSFHLNRVFQAEVGIPPHVFQTQVRVERAKQLLARGISISHAALRAGFFDQSHFTNHFKKLLGFTPGAYQRNVLAK